MLSVLPLSLQSHTEQWKPNCSSVCGSALASPPDPLGHALPLAPSMSRLNKHRLMGPETSFCLSYIPIILSIYIYLVRLRIQINEKNTCKKDGFALSTLAVGQVVHHINPLNIYLIDWRMRNRDSWFPEEEFYKSWRPLLTFFYSHHEADSSSSYINSISVNTFKREHTHWWFPEDELELIISPVNMYLPNNDDMFNNPADTSKRDKYLDRSATSLSHESQ